MHSVALTHSTPIARLSSLPRIPVSIRLPSCPSLFQEGGNIHDFSYYSNKRAEVRERGNWKVFYTLSHLSRFGLLSIGKIGREIGAQITQRPIGEAIVERTRGMGREYPAWKERENGRFDDKSIARGRGETDE